MLVALRVGVLTPIRQLVPAPSPALESAVPGEGRRGCVNLGPARISSGGRARFICAIPGRGGYVHPKV